MLAKIVGINEYDYTNKDGKQFSGLHFYCVHEQPNVNGFATIDFTIGSSAINFADIKELQLEDMVNVYFNQYRKVETVFKVK